MTESLVGNLMIASTLVTDPLFSRGVCLMVHHDESGAIGVMLNRPIMPPPQELLKILGSGTTGGDDVQTDPTTAQLPAEQPHSNSSGSRLPAQWQAEAASPPQAEADGESAGSAGANVASGAGLVHFGGPLSGPVVAVHGSLALAEVETGQGIYVAAQKDHLEALVRERPSDYRLIIGHAAWSAQQLASELEAGMWHLLPATPETVFPLQADLWPYLIRRATGASVASWVGADDNAGRAGLN